MKDHIVRAMTSDGLIRADAITSRHLTERARQIHGCSPLAAAALGRTLAAASMLGSQLKDEQNSITVQIRGDGILGPIVAVSDGSGNVRGFLKNPAADLPLRPDGKIDVGRGVGSGQMIVIRDMGLKDPYIGMIDLVSGEIAEDLSSYFAVSEQVPSACALGVLVDKDQSVRAAGGYILQLLPGADENVISQLEASVQKADAVTSMLDAGVSPSGILMRVLDGFSPKILSEHPVEYRCNCSDERVIRALASLGREELLKLAGEREDFEVTCDFCDKKYEFSAGQLREMAASL